MTDKPVITSVGEALELAKRAGWSLPLFIQRCQGWTELSPEKRADFEAKVKAIGVFNLTERPAYLQMHIEEPPLPPKWGEPFYNVTVNKLGDG